MHSDLRGGGGGSVYSEGSGGPTAAVVKYVYS